MSEDATGWSDFILELQKKHNNGTTTTEVTQRPALFFSWKLVHIGTLAHYSRSMVHNKTGTPRRATCDRASSHDGSLTGIFTYVNGWFLMEHVGKYTIHGPYMGIFSQVFRANQCKKKNADKLPSSMEEIQLVNQLMDVDTMLTCLFIKEFFVYILCHTRLYIYQYPHDSKTLFFFYFFHFSSRSCFLPSFFFETTRQIFNHQDLSSKLCCRPSNTCPPHAGRRVDAHGRDNVGRRSWDTDAGRWWRQHSGLKPPDTKPSGKLT